LEMENKEKEKRLTITGKSKLNLFANYVEEFILKEAEILAKNKGLDDITEDEIIEAIEIFEKNQPSFPMETKMIIETNPITTYFTQLDEASKTIESFTLNFNEQDGWTFRKTINEVHIWTKAQESLYLFCIKGVGYVPASAAEVINFVSNPANVPVYDNMCESGEVVQILDKHTHISHVKYSTRVCLLKQARDFTLVRHKYKKQDGTHILVGCSIDYPDIKPLKGYTRGKILCGGFVAIPKGENFCEVSYISYFDVINLPFESEWIKVNFIEKIYEKQPLNIYYLRKYFASLKNT